MIVYFDKENYVSYFKTVNDTEIGMDTLRMLKKHLSVHMNFNIDDLDEYEKILLEEFQTGIDHEFKLTFDSKLINKPLSNSSFLNKDAIYLLSDKEANNFKNSHCYLIGMVGEETETLKQLIINQDYSFHLEKTIGTDITATNPLDILNLPFSTLVIVDRYIFKGPETGGNISLYEYNLDKILKEAFKKKYGPSRLIFVYQVRVNVPNSNSNYDAGPDLNKLYNKIKKVIPKKCPSPEFFFIGVPYGTIDDEHDRFIITNYLRIKSGDTFVYFSSTNSINTKSTIVDYYSLAYKPYYLSTKKIIRKIATIIEETLNKHPTYSKVPTGTINNMVINF